MVPRLYGETLNRRDLAARYDRLLAPLAPVIRPVPPAPGDDPVLHLYAVLIDFAALGRSRAAAMRWSNWKQPAPPISTRSRKSRWRRPQIPIFRCSKS